MPTVAVLYFSASGHTARFASSISKGAASVPGVQTRLLAIRGEEIVHGRYKNDELMAELDLSDAILFGCPTFMAGPAAQFKAFADATGDRWHDRRWRDKLAAGFTVSGALSGDKLITLQYLQAFAMQHGMLGVGLDELPAQGNGPNRLGSWIGAMAIGGLDASETTPVPEDLLTGEALGKRVATFLSKA